MKNQEESKVAIKANINGGIVHIPIGMPVKFESDGYMIVHQDFSTELIAAAKRLKIETNKLMDESSKEKAHTMVAYYTGKLSALNHIISMLW